MYCLVYLRVEEPCVVLYSPAATSGPGEEVAIHRFELSVCEGVTFLFSLLVPVSAQRTSKPCTGVYHAASRPAYFNHHQLFVCLTTIDTTSTYISVTFIFQILVEKRYIYYCFIYNIKNFARTADVFFLTLYMQSFDVAIIYDYRRIHF